MKHGTKLLAAVLSVSMFFTNLGGAAAPVVWAADTEPDFYENIGEQGENPVGAEDIFLDDNDIDVYIEDDSEDVFFAEDEGYTGDENGKVDGDFEDIFEEAQVDDSVTDLSESEEISDDLVGSEETGDDFLPQDTEEGAPEDADSPVASETEEAETEDGEETADEAIMYVRSELAPDGTGLNASAKSVTDTISTFVKAFLEFTKEAKQGEELATCLTRFGGVTGIASGTIAILQMAGIIKDHSSDKLEDILYEVKRIQGTLDTMKTELEAISKKLDEMAVKAEEQQRQSTASDRISDWQAFATNYLEKLKTATEEYNTALIDGFASWWESESHDGIRICYSDYEGGSPAYSKVVYESTDKNGNPVYYEIPETADNGETIVPDLCIGIPMEYMPKTSVLEWDVNSYEETFKQLMAGEIISAAYDRKLEASAAFYEEWERLDNSGKENKAKEYAEEALYTLIYQIACNQMANVQSQWVTRTITLYENFCDRILEINSGIDALISIEYLTHGFEGEVVDDINNICDALVVTAGYYGIFAINIAGQDYRHQSNAKKEELKQRWLNTVNALDDKRNTALHGVDNYCYITGTVLNYQTSSVVSSITVKSRQHVAYFSSSATGWKLTDDIQDNSLLNNVNATVLYHQYLRQKEDSQSFAQYLRANGVDIPASFNGKLLTAFEGTGDYDVSKGWWMLAESVFGDYFKTGKWSQINKGNGDKVKNRKFRYTDMALYGYIDSETGECKDNTDLVTKAAYIEYDKYWTVDEAHVFHQNVSKVTHDVEKEYYPHPEIESSEYKYTDTYTFKTNVSMITQSMVSRGIPENGPLAAFDRDYIIKWEDEQPEEIPCSAADWSSYSGDIFDLYYSDDDKLDRGLLQIVDEAVASAAEEGITVNLSAEEKKEYAAKLKNRIFALQEEMQNNSSLKMRDVFGIDGNEAAKLELAKEILTPGYFDKEGNLKITAENMITSVCYEAGAALHFISENGEAKGLISSAFEVIPELVIWNNESGQFRSFDISDSVMQSLGLSMNVRLSAVSEDNGDSVTVVGPDMRERADITGSGSDRYVSVRSGRSGLFELTDQAVSIEGAEAVLSRKSFTYNGSVQKPGVRTIGGKKLRAGTDYYLTWSDASSKDAGTYTVTITGKGGYSGSTTAAYQIRRARNPLTATRKKAEKAIGYAKLSKGAQTVKRTEMYTVTKAQGTVSYKLVSVTKKAYAKYFKVDGKTGNITVGKGLPRGSYKLRLRTIAAGNDNYGKTSKLVVIRVVVR